MRVSEFESSGVKFDCIYGSYVFSPRRYSEHVIGSAFSATSSSIVLISDAAAAFFLFLTVAFSTKLRFDSDTGSGLNEFASL